MKWDDRAAMEPMETVRALVGFTARGPCTDDREVVLREGRRGDHAQPCRHLLDGGRSDPGTVRQDAQRQT